MTYMNSIVNDPVSVRLIFALIILIIGLGLKSLLSKCTIKLLTKIEIKKNRLDLSFFDALQKPLGYLFIFTAIFLSLAISPFVYTQTSLEQIIVLGSWNIKLSLIPMTFLTRLYGSIFVAILTWTVYDLEYIYEHMFSSLNSRLEITDNTLFIRYIARVIRFCTVALGIGIILTLLVPDLSGIVTGVGIGGVALAVISKDSLSNIFSGMLLLLDKPFVIGDWVELDNIEGIVEDITFRSTRVRTFTQSVVVIPNNKIGNISITNWSRMSKRRVKFDLGLSYNTSPEQISACTNSIISYLSTQKGIEPDTSLVHFENFGDYALNLQVLYYIEQTDYASYLSVKEQVNLELLKLCDTLNVDIAFPTQTLYVNNNCSIDTQKKSF